MSPLDDDDNYGDIADEDFIEVLSQTSQSLPPLPSKRAFDADLHANEDDVPARISDSDDGRPKRKKYKIHMGNEVPEARVIGATQAENLPDSSPYRIRGPIYRKPRPPPPAQSPQVHTTGPKKIRDLRSMFGVAAKHSPSKNDAFARELEDLPANAFSSDDEEFKPISIGSSPARNMTQTSLPRERLVAPLNNLRQTTLFGGRAIEEVSASQAKRHFNYIVDLPPEAPTHHALDHNALKTWVYPMNLGAVRDYQYSIVYNGLFSNLLVSLPTGLGKTFIAATIMLNFFRWTKDAKIVFVAPTKPLVSQQVRACFNVVGIPRQTTTMLTGEQPPGLRAEEWAEKRVFFMTPQTLENDLRSGIADPKKIVLLVVDEAHRATGNYSYVKAVSFLRRFSDSFRVLALTATPGSSVEAVQEVIDSLEIAKVEIRTEDSLDIRQFVHQRTTEEIILDPSDEMILVKEHLAKALQPLVNQLCGQNAYYNRDPMSLTAYGLVQAQSQWYKSDAGRSANQGLKNMLRALFAILASVAHSIKLLNFHGIGPFYSNIKDFRRGVEEGNKGGKYRTQIVNSLDFKKMMDLVEHWLSKDGFVGHPKLTYLCDTILNHFLDAGEGRLLEGAPPSSTRVIVFSEYRDSAEEIVQVLNRHGPMVRASVFVGQADSARSAGMNQAKQLETINKFKSGIFNVIVATSIGEEGLDIGQVDLIICYDSSSSPIRMLQRMGRTGRKRAGTIVCLLMRGKEEESFSKSKHSYQKMQEMISSGERFNFRHDLSRRIVPREIKPMVEKRIIDIPVENTQDESMPGPKKRRAHTKRLPPKKFHMPDGVETGFRKASKISGEDGKRANSGMARQSSPVDLDPEPSSKSVFLDLADELELHRRYQKVEGAAFEEVGMPDLTSQTVVQRTLNPTVNVSHGKFTKRCVQLFQTLANSQNIEDRYHKPYGDTGFDNLDWIPRDLPTGGHRPKISKAPEKARNTATIQRQRKVDSVLLVADETNNDEDDEMTPRGSLTQAASSNPECLGDSVRSSETPSVDYDEAGSLEDFIADEDERQTIGSSSCNSKGDRQRTIVDSATQESVDDDILNIDGQGNFGQHSPLPSSISGATIPANVRVRQKRRLVEEDDSDK